MSPPNALLALGQKIKKAFQYGGVKLGGTNFVASSSKAREDELMLTFEMLHATVPEKQVSVNRQCVHGQGLHTLVAISQEQPPTAHSQPRLTRACRGW